jgi:hypothetical protein
VNGIVPIKIVIGVGSVPAPVMRLKRVMCPANAGIGPRNNNRLTAKSECPDVRRVGVSDPRLDRSRRGRAAGLQRRLVDRTSLRKVIVNVRVACDVSHVATGRQCFGKLAVSFH